MKSVTDSSTRTMVRARFLTSAAQPGWGWGALSTGQGGPRQQQIQNSFKCVSCETWGLAGHSLMEGL